MKTLILLLLVSLLAASGCAPRIKMYYSSDPSGASVYQNGRAIGITPFLCEYQFTEQEDQAGYKAVGHVKAIWPSGAIFEIPKALIYKDQGINQQAFFARPAEYPNRNIDTQNALELEKIRLMREQNDIAEQTRRDQNYNAMRNKSATSTIIGNTIYTNSQ